jgi:hypothetical protein
MILDYSTEGEAHEVDMRWEWRDIPPKKRLAGPKFEG